MKDWSPGSDEGPYSWLIEGREVEGSKKVSLHTPPELGFIYILDARFAI